MRYFTSDTHYGHANIIRYCGRPYDDTEQMDADLVAHARATLGDHRDLWHLGDVAMGRIDDTLPNLARIGADVTLVAGNHDRCHPLNGPARSERFADVYRERCRLTRLIPTDTALTLSNGVTVQVSHFPYPDKGAYDEPHEHERADKLARWRPVDDGSWLLCGHVHDSWRQRGRMINVGVDAWGGIPVSEADLVALIEAGPADLDRLPWPRTD
ncbi:metallophosphoesterase family protein [Gordonia caeni]|uniref:Metallophosphoesterase family protein n=1 Tax=Gordonia caeni TaxID=1007097 RepID=A0ABP7P1Q4_9ACTN